MVLGLEGVAQCHDEGAHGAEHLLLGKIECVWFCEMRMRLSSTLVGARVGVGLGLGLG